LQTDRTLRHIRKIANNNPNRLMTPLESTPPQNAANCLVQEGCSARLQLCRRVAELEARVSSDALTGLWNRAHFDQIVEKELDRSRRHKQPLSLILLDVDRFKDINDRFGHQTGDTVLRELAIVISMGMRSSDAVFRWGGEEFAVLAMSSGYRGAGRLAEALRAMIASHLFPPVGLVSASLGVAEHIDSESAKEWFGRADAMLYAAKRDGRNAVRIDARGNSDLWSAQHVIPTLNLAWQEAYECGDSTIDRQHRELFELANALIDAFLSGAKDFAAIAPAYDRLMGHIVLHFTEEEAILQHRGYAELKTHRRAHRGLLARAQELRGRVADGSAGLGALVEFLAGDVVTRHLFRMDRDFFPLFRGK